MGIAVSIPTEKEAVLFSVLAGGIVIKFASMQLLHSQKRRQFVEVGRVDGIYLYPIKSTAPWSLDSADCTPLGVRHDGLTDRHMFLTTADGSFITMRRYPAMALIRTTVNGEILMFDAPGMQTLTVPKRQTVSHKNLKQCRIYDDTVLAANCGDEAGAWFSRYLEVPGLRLLFYPPNVPKREAVAQSKPWPHKAQAGDRAAFADFAAYLIASSDSLDALNDSLERPVTIRNFRPNIVVRGNGAFKEESWSEVVIGDASFRALDLCTRCLQTTVDPDTGTKDPAMEPLETLKRLNSNKAYQNKAIFGVNAALDNQGRIQVGDKVFAYIAA